MTSKAIARIVPINGNSWPEFYAATVNESSDAWEGIKDDGKGYHCYKRHWKVEMLPVEWDGEGLPPVGTIIEVESPRHGWVEATVTAVTDNWIVAKYSDGAEFAGCHRILKDGVFINHHTTFRPIRSARDKAVDKMLHTFVENNYESTRVAVSAIYDAIKSGTITID